VLQTALATECTLCYGIELTAERASAAEVCCKMFV